MHGYIYGKKAGAFLFCMRAIIQIPQPCTEHWDTMQPEIQGRRCKACAHVVIDFTQWELQDIAAYLRAHRGEKTCGRFLKTQVNTPFDLTVFAPRIVMWQASYTRKIAALILVCFALATTSCSNEKAKPAETSQRPAIMGETSPPGVPGLDTLKDTMSIGTVAVRVPDVVEAIQGYPDYETTMGLPEYQEMPIPNYPPKDTAFYQPKIGPPREDTSGMSMGRE